MGRFLARALAAMEVGPMVAAPPAVSRPAAAVDFGGYGDFGDGAENENQPPLLSPWPEGVDIHATRDAARISGLIAIGADWRWCPTGGLELIKPDGLMWALSPNYSRRLHTGRLLPLAVLEAAP